MKSHWIVTLCGAVIIAACFSLAALDGARTAYESAAVTPAQAGR